MRDRSGAASNDVVYEGLVDHVSSRREGSQRRARPDSSRGGRYQVLDQVVPSTCGSMVMSHGRTSTVCLSVECACLLTPHPRGSKTPFGPRGSGRCALPSAGQQGSMVGGGPADRGRRHPDAATNPTVNRPARPACVRDRCGGTARCRLGRPTTSPARHPPDPHQRRRAPDPPRADRPHRPRRRGQRWRQVTGPGSPHCRAPRCRPGPHHRRGALGIRAVGQTGTTSAQSPLSGPSATPCRIRRMR